MEVSGSIRKIEETKQITDTFKKRSLILTTEEQYPQHLNIEFVQDKTALLDAYNEGDKVKISINLRGREWTSPQGEVKYFNSINGWRIDKEAAGGAAPADAGAAPASQNTATPTPPSMPPLDGAEEDDLPF